MQNFIHYFKWTAVLTVVSNSFFMGAKNEKYSMIRNAGKFISDKLDHVAIFHKNEQPYYSKAAYKPAKS